MDPDDLRIDPGEDFVVLQARVYDEFTRNGKLRLTELQIRRLFMLTPQVCSSILTALTGAGLLRCNNSGQYFKS